MRDKRRLVLVFMVICFFVFASTARIVAAEDNIINDMNFKGADIRDVLRAVAEVAEVNLVMDDSVSGSITIHLRELSFDKALELITQTRGLEYRWDGNTAVVASPDRIEEIYSRVVTKIIQVEDPEPERIKSIVSGVYPELNIQIDDKNRQMILVAGEETVMKAEKLIRQIEYREVEESETGEAEEESEAEDTIAEEETQDEEAKDEAEQEEEVEVTELITIEHTSASDIANNVRDIYPEITISVHQASRQLIFRGHQERVEKAKKLVTSLDIKEEEDEKQEEKIVEEVQEKEKEEEEQVITEIVQIYSDNPGQLVDNLTTIYPDLTLLIQEERGKLIIRGKENEVKEALNLVDDLDIDKEMEEDVPEEVEQKEEENTEEKEEEEPKSTASIAVEYGSLEDYKEQLEELFPELDIKSNDLSGRLIISGIEVEVKEASKLIEEWESNEVQKTELVRIDYGEISNIQNITGEMFPDLNLQVNDTNREIVVKGKAKEVKEATAFMEKMDKSRQQIIIEARVIEISSSKLEEVGINSENLSSIHFIKDSTDPEGENIDIENFGQLMNIELTWPQFLDAVRRSGASETLANPHLMTLNGEEAKMLIGDRIPVKTQSSEGEINISYIEAGVTLEFLPWITEEGSIELEIKPQVSNIGEELYEGYPSIRTREVETKLRLQDGETFAIGGLIQEDESESFTRVPILSEIPIMGEIFKSRSDDFSKTELLIFITPKIVEDTSDYDTASFEQEVDL